ncbi:MAG: SRPBCC family protein [Planctomycetes bacterium]|nr:SRPBCC family protein [Planctomycetota bacterium]
MTPPRTLAVLSLLASGLVLGGEDPHKEPLVLAPDTVEALGPLLGRGELVLVASRDDGSPDEAVAMARMRAPLGRVWETLLDYPSYPRWVPKVVRSDVVRRAEGAPEVLDVKFEIEVPGWNYRYTIRYAVDEAGRTVLGSWHSGDLEGGRWNWRLYASGEETVVTYATHTDVGRASRLVRELDDEYHSLSYGLDLSSAVLMVKALQREAERREAAAAAGEGR